MVRTGQRAAVFIADTACFHTEVFRIDDHGDIFRVEYPLQFFRDLNGQALLHLGTARNDRQCG